MTLRDHRVRSALFAPGSEPRKMRATARFGADVVVLDLEDAVADDRKVEARTMTAQHLAEVERPQPLGARINGDDTGLLWDDLDAVARAGADFVVVPKVESPALLVEIEARLAALEKADLTRGRRVGVAVLLETAAGIVDAVPICRTTGRLDLVMVGTGDLAADLDVPLTTEARELETARAQVVLACRAAGLPSPVDGPVLDLHDVDALSAASAHSRSLGFQGRVVVHPPQIGTVHAAYGALDDLELQARIVREFETAQRTGLASIRVGDLFVDYPTYHVARRRLAAAADPEAGTTEAPAPQDQPHEENTRTQS